MTKEEAGARYLGIVCQRNEAAYRLNDAIVAQEETFFNGGDPDLTEIRAAAAEAMRVSRIVVELFDDSYYIWPEGLDDHLALIRESTMAESTTLSAIANASRFEDAYYAQFTGPDTAASIAEVRYQLGLSADTSASCQGYEAAADVLHTEMLERNDYLASFKSEE